MFLKNITDLAAKKCVIAITFMDAEIIEKSLDSKVMQQHKDSQNSKIIKDNSGVDDLIIKSDDGQVIY